MSSTLKTLRLIGDPTRLRILALLRHEELSVVELQEILSMGQSRISSHLSQLKHAGLVTDRRSGKNMIYAFGGGPEPIDPRIDGLLDAASEELPETADDIAALALALQKRKDRARAYFDTLAGRFGRTYCPGKSWKAVAETLLQLMEPMVIADLGAGEGTLSQLLAQRAKRVIAIDNSRRMVEFGSRKAGEKGCTNLEFRLGDIEDPPIDDEMVDLALLSQALHHAQKPERAIGAAFRVLRPGGRIVILDLLKHSFEDARELYADVWLGFSELEIRRFLGDTGFRRERISVVDREEEAPHFQTLLAIAEKPGGTCHS